MEIIIVKWKGRKKAGNSQPRDKIKKKKYSTRHNRLFFIVRDIIEIQHYK